MATVLLSVAEAAARKECSTSTIYRLIKQKKLSSRSQKGRKFVIEDEKFHDLVIANKKSKRKLANKKVEKKSTQKITDDRKLPPPVAAERFGCDVQEHPAILECIARGDLFVVSDSPQKQLEKPEDAPLLALKEPAELQRVRAEQILEKIRADQVNIVHGKDEVFIINDENFANLEFPEAGREDNWDNSLLGKLVRDLEKVNRDYSSLKQEIRRLDTICQRQLQALRYLGDIGTIEEDYEIMRNVAEQQEKECDGFLAELPSSTGVLGILRRLQLEMQKMKIVLQFFRQTESIQRARLAEGIHPLP